MEFLAVLRCKVNEQIAERRERTIRVDIQVLFTAIFTFANGGWSSLLEVRTFSEKGSVLGSGASAFLVSSVTSLAAVAAVASSASVGFGGVGPAGPKGGF